MFKDSCAVIETKCLYLREMTENDFEALKKVLSDPEIMQHYPSAFDESGVKNWIQRNIDRYRIFGFGLWAVCLKEKNEMIGDCGLTMQLVNGQIKPEIGYHIRADQQKKRVRQRSGKCSSGLDIYQHSFQHRLFLYEICQ